MWTNWPDWAHIEGRFLQLYTGLHCTRWQPCSLLYIIWVGMVWLSYTLTSIPYQTKSYHTYWVWYVCKVRCNLSWSGAAMGCRVSLGWGKVHAATHPSIWATLVTWAIQVSLTPLQVLIYLQLELILLQWQSTGAHGSLETTFKILLKSTWSFLIVGSLQGGK